jgi:hypothetical protein
MTFPNDFYIKILEKHLQRLNKDIEAEAFRAIATVFSVFLSIPVDILNSLLTFCKKI